MRASTMAPKPPKELGRAGKALWRQIQRDYPIDDGEGLAILTVAAKAADTMSDARSLWQLEGMTVTNPKTGGLHQHPACKVEAQARAHLLQALKQLHLELPKDDGVPAYMRGG